MTCANLAMTGLDLSLAILMLMLCFLPTGINNIMYINTTNPRCAKLDLHAIRDVLALPRITFVPVTETLSLETRGR